MRRRCGATAPAALDLVYVACGRFDGFWEEGLKPWDVAAGALIIEEAGGQATQFDGSPYDIYSPPFLSNGLIHEAMRRVMSQQMLDARCQMLVKPSSLQAI
ncbi:MAG: inositol monophosphatase family protein [Pyrinomonadaceae bacterium]